MRRALATLVLISLTVSACLGSDQTSAPDGPTGEPTTGPTIGATVTTTTTTSAPVRICEARSDEAPETIDASDSVLASVAISEAVFTCSERVALVQYGDVAAAVRAAMTLDGAGPVLVVDGPIEPVTVAELERLSPREVLTFGVDRGLLASLDVNVVPGPADGVVPDAPMRLQTRQSGGHLWLASNAEMSALTWAAARASNASTLPIPDDGLLADPVVARAVRSADAITVAGDGDPGWQLKVLRRGAELPGGGFTLFPGRRIVALYGNPTTPYLGVLGEQGPADGLARLMELAEGYDGDGLPVLPAFEIIATVASAHAGGDSDYSDETAIATLRPWIDFAAEHDMYVVLDLQSGRTDFLTQAKYYEEFLRLPHVGLALDPEWRLGPNQVHLRQVGTVDASEVNRVAEWLAGIVRDEALPQKLLLVHQFKFSMITNRDQILTPPELAVVVQMDGQGPLATKYGTFRAITADTDAVGWRWGWKNFFDEDSPMATAAQVLDLDPPVVFVSFQ